MALPIGLQLYTVRDTLAQDFEGTLAQVAKIGYPYVELGGLHKRTPEAVRALLDNVGLKAIAAHIGIDQLRDKMDQAIADAKTLGYDMLVCPGVGKDWRTPEGIARLAAILDQSGRHAAAAGMTVAYHNHAFEFDKLSDGSRAWDIIYGQTSGQYVRSEIDLYWASLANEDPVKLMRQFTGRVPLLHIKDMAQQGAERKMTEVGTGVIDYAAVVRAAPACGVRYYIVEQDNNWAGSPLESARISYENLKKLVG